YFPHDLQLQLGLAALPVAEQVAPQGRGVLPVVGVVIPFDLLAVHLDNDIVRLQARPIGRRLRLDLLHPGLIVSRGESETAQGLKSLARGVGHGRAGQGESYGRGDVKERALPVRTGHVAITAAVEEAPQAAQAQANGDAWGNDISDLPGRNIMLAE